MTIIGDTIKGENFESSKQERLALGTLKALNVKTIQSQLGVTNGGN